MKSKCKIFIILSVIFGSLMIVFLCLFLSFMVTSNTYKTQLQNTYMKSFYEMVDNINSLEVDLSKIVATNNIDTQRELLSGIYETCMIGVTNVNNLPISNSKLKDINKLLNTAGGFSYSLLLDNYDGNLVSLDDFTQLENIYDNVKELRYDINEYMRKLKYDYNILDDVDYSDENNSSFSAGFIDSESGSKKVPTLIYDGPFSDSVLNKEIKGLGSNIITHEDGLNLVKELYQGNNVNYIGDTTGKFETYNYEVEIEDKEDIRLYVSVTKQGGMILNITSFGYGKGDTISIEEGIDIAENFASDLGISNMYMVWYQQTGNILYVNLAPIVNHTIYYSDLIKVKVDLSLQKVVGWEATNYATNHIGNRVFENSIGILDAEKNLNPLMKVVERNLCIIPDKFVGELFAYEFICKWEDYTYYIYIDANTGNEVNILRVIDTTNGSLLM